MTGFGLTPKKPATWWHGGLPGEQCDFLDEIKVSKGMLLQALEKDTAVHVLSMDDLHPRRGHTVQQIETAVVAAFGGRQVAVLHDTYLAPTSPGRRRRGGGVTIACSLYEHNNNAYLSATGMLVVQHHGGKDNPKISMDLQDLNPDVVQRVRACLAESTHTKDHPPVGELRTLTKNTEGYHLQDIGLVKHKFVAGNYTPAVLAKIAAAVKDMKAKEPSGRLLLMNGPPGTGKTYLVRHIIQQATGKGFTAIIIPSHMVADLANPELISCLLDHHCQTQKRILLVIEDADLVIAKRAAKNMSGLTTLLGMGDGLMGDALNIYVVATTNQAPKELDDAMMRPGRLSAHIEVGAIDPAQVGDIYQRLTKRVRTFTEPLTLAEVYAAARAA